MPRPLDLSTSRPPDLPTSRPLTLSPSRPLDLSDDRRGPQKKTEPRVTLNPPPPRLHHSTPSSSLPEYASFAWWNWNVFTRSIAGNYTGDFIGGVWSAPSADGTTPELAKRCVWVGGWVGVCERHRAGTRAVTGTTGPATRPPPYHHTLPSPSSLIYSFCHAPTHPRFQHCGPGV